MRRAMVCQIGAILFVVVGITSLHISTVAAEPPGQLQSKIEVDANDSKEGETKYRLAYRYTPNEKYYFEIKQISSIRTQVGEVSKSAKMESTTHMHYRIVSVDPGQNAVLESFIDRIQAKTGFDDKVTIDWDSDSGDPRPDKLRSFAEAIGKPLSQSTYSSAGKLLKAVSLKHAYTRPGPPVAVATSAHANDPSRAFLVLLPEKPIRIGETWRDPITVEVTVPPKLKRDVKLGRKYTLVSVDGDLATIRLKTTVLSRVINPFVQSQLIQRAQQGTILFDIKRGVIISKTLRVKKKVVIGFAGDNSLMSAESTLTERLIPAPKLADGKSDKSGSSRTLK